MARMPNRMKIHQHHESKKWTRLPATETCRECYPVRRPFLETAFGRLPPEIRTDIFKDVLKVGYLSPLKDGISVPMARSRHGSPPQLTGFPAGPASCLALLQTCRQIYHETSALFYTINTLHLSNPQDMFSFLCHLGTERCGELRSLHLEDLLVQVPFFSQCNLDCLRSDYGHSEMALAQLASFRREEMHPDTQKAVQLLNNNLRKLYLDMQSSQILEYIKLITQIPGFRNRGIIFESPVRWFVMAPSIWETRSWYAAFLDNLGSTQLHEGTCNAFVDKDEKYRVEVDILPILPERRTDIGAILDYDRSVDGRFSAGSWVDRAILDLNIF